MYKRKKLGLCMVLASTLPNVRTMCTLKYECHQMYVRTGEHSILKVYTQSTHSVLRAHFELTVHCVHAACWECSLCQG